MHRGPICDPPCCSCFALCTGAFGKERDENDGHDWIQGHDGLQRQPSNPRTSSAIASHDAPAVASLTVFSLPGPALSLVLRVARFNSRAGLLTLPVRFACAAARRSKLPSDGLRSAAQTRLHLLCSPQSRTLQQLCHGLHDTGPDCGRVRAFGGVFISAVVKAVLTLVRVVSVPAEVQWLYAMCGGRTARPDSRRRCMCMCVVWVIARPRLMTCEFNLFYEARDMLNSLTNLQRTS